MFTKQHYEAIARVIREVEIPVTAAITVAEEMAGMFGKDNPNFNREKFVTACGL